MRKDFTKEDIIKKHETNVKSAFTAYFLAFVLGLIYIVRYLIKQEFDFYFSLSFTDMMLKLESSGEISKAICIAAIVVFAVIYIRIDCIQCSLQRINLLIKIFYILLFR